MFNEKILTSKCNVIQVSKFVSYSRKQAVSAKYVSLPDMTTPWLYLDRTLTYVCVHIWLTCYSLGSPQRVTREPYMGTWHGYALWDGSYCAQLCLNLSIMELQARNELIIYIYIYMVAGQIRFWTTLFKYKFHRFAGSWWVAICIYTQCIKPPAMTNSLTNWLLWHFFVISSSSQPFPSSSTQNQVELSEWATGCFMHCIHIHDIHMAHSLLFRNMVTRSTSVGQITLWQVIFKHKFHWNAKVHWVAFMYINICIWHMAYLDFDQLYEKILIIWDWTIAT